jgi:cytochrome c peroxidase
MNSRNLKYSVRISLPILTIALFFAACQKDPLLTDGQSVHSCGTPYNLALPNYFPPMPVPASNPFTVEGIELGRQLFYEPMLSGNNTQACADCHKQEFAFSDNTAFSKGIDGFEGFRNSMPIANLGYSTKFFWDGKANSLEEVMLFPIQSEVEMHENIYEAVHELQASAKYRGLFYQAFCDSTVSIERMSLAMAQFMRTLLSHNNMISPNVGQQHRNQVQERGFQVFVDEKKGDCFHCHAVNMFSTNFEFFNNGLFNGGTSDKGLFGQTGNQNDVGKFKTSSLLNLRYTAPYMHDGRFTNLREVINFYDTGFHVSATLDPNLLKHTKDGKPVPRAWTQQDKDDLLVFLLTLSDTSFLSNPAYAKPLRSTIFL